jgi:4-hydroxybenzoate polyprenyltransferase
MTHLWRLMRPHQWLKNGFVLVGAAFGHQWNTATLVQVGLMLASFCAVSSAVYVLNDVADIAADRLHPVKRFRPLASGQVQRGHAIALGLVLGAIALALAASVGVVAFAIVGGYSLLNIAYTLRLKRIVVIDVFTIAAGFMLRLLAGTLGVGIPPSSWLLLCGMMLALFLGFAKRRSELSAVVEGYPSRPVLMAYSVQMLDQFLAITATCTILGYALYAVSPDTIAVHGTDKLVVGLPFVAYGMFRYLYLLHQTGVGQDTARDVLGDTHLLAAAFGWIAVTLWLLS